jgi:alkaline phosphatase D
VWGNEYTLMRRAIDLRPVEIAPPEFQQRLLLTAEDWDGAPNERNALLAELSAVDNVVAVTGDLHAFFAGTPYADADPETRIVELVAGSVSSTTWQTGITRAVEQSPDIPPEAALLAQLVGTLLVAKPNPNPHVGWFDLERNGYAVVVAGLDALDLTAFAIGDDDVAKSPEKLGDGWRQAFEPTVFRVLPGQRELWMRNAAGDFLRWDRETASWV